MGVRTYISLIWRRAGRDALGWVKPQSFGDIARLGMVYAVGAFGFWLFSLERVGFLSLAAIQEEVATAIVFVVIVPVILFALAFMVALIFGAPYRVWKGEALRARLIESAETEVDFYAAWADRDPLSLHEAASLWVGEAPPRGDGELSERAHVMWLELSDAAAKRKLSFSNPAHTSYQDAFDSLSESITGIVVVRPASLVSRAELQKFAEIRKKRPAFLYGATGSPIGFITMVDAFRYIGEDSQWALSCPEPVQLWNEALRRAVLDALSTGQVKATGRRPGEGGAYSPYGMTEIESVFWRDAIFSADQQIMEWIDANKVYGRDKGEQKLAYIDVELDAEDVKRVWPPLRPKQREGFKSPVKRAREENEVQRAYSSIRPGPSSPI